MRLPLQRLCLSLAVVLLCRSASADFVVLANGTVIEGDVVEDEEAGTVSVTVRGATMTFPRAKVARVGTGSPKPASNVTVSAEPRGARPAPTGEKRETIVRRNLVAQSRARTILKAIGESADDKVRDAALEDVAGLRPFPTVIVAEFLTAKTPRPARLVAALAIGRVGDGSASYALANAAVTDPDAGVRRAAGVSIGRIRDLRCLSALIDVAAKAKTPASVTRAAEAIRHAGRTEAIGGLIVKAMREVKRTTARGTVMGSQSGPGGTGMGIATLNVHERVMSTGPPPGVPVLRVLTGQDFGSDLNAWARWWKANQRTFTFQEPKSAPPAG